MRNKGALTFFAILVGIAGISLLGYRLANRSPRITAPTGVAGSATFPSTNEASAAGQVKPPPERRRPPRSRLRDRPCDQRFP